MLITASCRVARNTTKFKKFVKRNVHASRTSYAIGVVTSNIVVTPKDICHVTPYLCVVTPNVLCFVTSKVRIVTSKSVLSLPVLFVARAAAGDGEPDENKVRE